MNVKRFFYSFVLVLALQLGVSGCTGNIAGQDKTAGQDMTAQQGTQAAETAMADGQSVYNVFGKIDIQEKTDQEDSLSELDYDKARQSIGLTKNSIQEELEKQSGNYGLDYLSVGQKHLYIEIYKILTHQAEDILISTLDAEEIEAVFQCVLNDHPEIFYVAGYTYTKYTHDSEIKRITFSGSYTLTAEEIQDREKRMEEYIVTCLSGISQAAEDYDKVKYVYEYLIFNTEYNLESTDNQNICSVFLNGESVCQGYAKATQLLLKRLGVMATLVIGTVENGEGHAWNLVSVNGAYYYVDTTWGDAYYVLGESGYDYPKEKLPNINYDYLLVTTDQLCQTHSIDNVVSMPRCVATEANYYVREGAYFTSLDRDRIGVLFDKAYEQGRDYVTMKFSDIEVYREVEEALLDNQEVFSYLDAKDGVVAYTNSERQLSISFWL